jgi:hypothetical protein
MLCGVLEGRFGVAVTTGVLERLVSFCRANADGGGALAWLYSAAPEIGRLDLRAFLEAPGSGRIPHIGLRRAP